MLKIKLMLTLNNNFNYGLNTDLKRELQGKKRPNQTSHNFYKTNDSQTHKSVSIQSTDNPHYIKAKVVTLKHKFTLKSKSIPKINLGTTNPQFP